MKATDLMVGDWVMNACDAPRKVYELVQDQVTYELEGGGLNTAHCNQLYPIPLTEEILVKNGFGKVNNQYFFGQVEIKELRDCWVIIINKEDADVDINIHYVHQLQHLLRLVGIEKEIEL